MGRIKKVATERHTATASPFISDFVQQAASVPLHQLPAKLESFPQQWPFPRGDLYHWIPLLDRFDLVLELFNKEYGLVKGPQQEPFECRLLQKGDAEEGPPYASTGAQQKELDTLGYSSAGDREVVESIIHFTRILLEHCGNRSLYASSGRVNDLLNTTSLGLLRLCLRLSLRLAQRYQVARYKNNHPQAAAILLQNHYSFNFDRLQKIAQPFPKPAQPTSALGLTPGKGKEKASPAAYNPHDLVAIAKEPKSTTARGDVASVHLTYYENSGSTSRPGSAHQSSETAPITPTPVRRTSALGPSRDRPSMGERGATSADLDLTPVKSKETDSTSSSAPKTYYVPSTKVAETPACALVQEAMKKLPSDSSYEILNRIRVAKAFTTPETSSQLVLETRLLAVANLAYALGESKFHENIGQPDSEEPKRFHLAQQLCDLLTPATNGQDSLSLDAETAVLLTIEALSKSRHKSPEISDALQISHNHGVLYFELRKVIATLSVDQHKDKKLELQETEWRDATFDLTNALLQSNAQARPGERMVSAGIMAILVEALNLRTLRAERFHEKILQFFDSFIHNISTAFQTLANMKGLEVIADLMSYEVTNSLQKAKDGHGLPAEFRSKVVDYSIPFGQQSTLRQLFKFMTHMFEHNAGTHDRLLRNMVDTPQVLGALHNVIENGSVFGSNVWSGAVNIMSSFIHNEPTSFQVVAEAGLVKSLLQTIVPWDIKGPDEEDTKLEDMPVNLEYKDGKLQYPTASGILPIGETMCDIPAAFGAICLNESGMKLFKSSKAMLKFMDIFVSPPHVRALEDEGQTAGQIGQAFDELARHHPQLKEQIMWTVVVMIRRVGEVCRYLAEREGVGAKLWERTLSSIVVAGGKNALVSQDSESSKDGSQTVSATDIDEVDHDRVNGVPFISACFKFLEGFFHNTSMCSAFCESGGAIYLLDVATSASNPYDLVAFPVFGKISQVLKTMCEAKPHLVLPAFIDRTRQAITGLKPVVENKNSDGAFATFMDLSKPQISSLPTGVNGTTVVKCLAVLHMLTHVLGRALSPPQFTSSRHSNHPNQLFTILNFTDVYIELVDGLSRLHAACIWENLALQNAIPEKWKQQTDPKPFTMRRVDANGVVELAADIRTDNQTTEDTSNGSDKTAAGRSNEDKFALKNARAVRYLLSQAPMGVESFFHSLGQALVPKRSGDTTTKQHASIVADHLAQGLVRELQDKKFESTDEVMDAKYTVQVVTARTRTLLKNSHNMETWGAKEALTLVLNKFYLANGFDELNQCLDRFGNVLARQPQSMEALDSCAHEGLNTILGFYAHVVRTKCISEAAQTGVISVRDHKQPDYFTPGQFLVEIRDAVLPTVRKLWESPALEGAGDNHARTIIDILRTILKADGEDRAIKRSEKASRREHPTKPVFKLRSIDGSLSLKSSGYGDQLAREALYRCNNHEANAQEYCHLRKTCDRAPRFPIPEGEPTFSDESSSSAAMNHSSETAQLRHGPSASELAQRQESVEMTDAAGEQQEPAEAPREREAAASENTEIVSSEGADMMSDDDTFTIPNLSADLQQSDLMAMVGGSGRLQDFEAVTGAGASAALPAEDTHQPFITIDDLDEKRTSLRDVLIDRCLEVLSAQPTITFELADFIQAAVSKSGEAANPRAEIGGTLVSSLMSLQTEDPSEESGRKISAYAHLVALILQDRDFFDSTLDELKGYFDALVSWIQLGQDQKAEDAPWIEMILLIIERVLAEDEQPVEISWQPPPADEPLKDLPEPHLPEPVVSSELRQSVFDALLDLLPRIGKNASLALSVCRVLVMLTRRRDLAERLNDKHSLSRLFVMVRQLAGSINDKLQGSIMIILRHMIEDGSILRQVMQTEIRTAFENYRSSRAMDTTTYTRNLYHLVLRDPKLFLDVTKDMVEITRFDGNPQRAQALVLKKDKPSTSEKTAESEEVVQDESTAKESIEEGLTEAQKSTEIKAPTVEVTDGIIQFLLRELSNYKDVEDKQMSTLKDQAVGTTNGSTGDVEMADAAASTSTPNASTTTSDSNARSDRPTFKPEEHVIYIYRCFILQCLAELLASYNRTKIEFINFSRKPETQPATPSKPRSGTLNYLLNVLIPVGTLEHRDDIVHRKKLSTSHWATNVLVSLSAKTPELQTPRAMSHQDIKKEDSDLTFVRKFVLEHALRAFREAVASTEPLDQRYSRLLALGELFNRILGPKSMGPSSSSYGVPSQHIGKLMYEKNFVSALTSAIAELDLNFPNAKRAVKYVLGPLRALTNLGVTLSQTSDLSSSTTGTTDEDDISSSTSVSDGDEDGREQTPDLYRNSTLGMFESSAGHDEDDESETEEDDEDEMYDDGYDEEMDYDEDHLGDHGDVISDDDEDIEAMDDMGDIEGVPGDVEIDVDVVMDGEDDDNTDSEGVSDEGTPDDDDEEEDDDPDFTAHFDMEEITGDDENASMPDHDVTATWEDDAAEFGVGDADEGGSPHGGPLDQLAQVIGAEEERHGIVHIDMGNGDDEYFEDELPPGAEEEDEEDEEVDYENNVVYEPELEEDDDDEEDMRWDWDAGPPPTLRGHHHHHHHRPGFEMFGMVGGESFRAALRTHRPTSNPRGEDEGTNPLLQREDARGAGSRERNVADDIPSTRVVRRALPPRQGDAFIQELVSTIGPNGAQTMNVNLEQRFVGGLGGQLWPIGAIERRHGGHHALIDIDPARPWREQVGLPRFADMIPTGRSHESRTVPGTDESQAVEFRPIPTVSRWQEEARMFFGGRHHEKATRIISSLLRILVPPAMESKRQHDQAEAERKAAEEKQKEEDERKRIEIELVEQQAREEKEREEREAREAEEARAREQAEQEVTTEESTSAADGSTSMEGVEQAETAEPEDIAPPPTEQAVEEPAQRVTTTIRNREIDITNLGIDLEFLNGLPEELREEVIMGQIAEQRTQAVRAGEQPTDISQEFLNALPPDLQRDVLRQEAIDRRHAEREENRRRAVQEGGAQPTQPEELNNADFMAMLEPNLRQAILMDADENTLATLPEEIQAEARNLLGERRLPRPDQIPRIGRFPNGADPRILNRLQGDRAQRTAREGSRQRRPVVQMLDKAGIATLLRLMFVSLHHKAKSNLHHILSDVCKNVQNRAEVISLLLSILQDGTADIGAVERSFAALSLRAKQQPGPKTPQPLKRTATGTINTSAAELSPLNIVQQCMGTLDALTFNNSRVPLFFLTEHETVTSQKVKAVRKGKAPEVKAARYPLNALLVMLDRKLITENTGVMETLASLLKRVTHPLQFLLRRPSEATEAENTENVPPEGAAEEQQPHLSAGSDVPMAEVANAGLSTDQETASNDTAGAEASTDVAAGFAPGESESLHQDGTKQDEKKKPRELLPPEVPEENIRLVVNIITARECPSKTFLTTLDVIKNLSNIPGAKEIFGRELVRQAQDLSEAVLVDLEELAKQIDSANSGTDLQGLALANFSSATSQQHKLLRVLVALDHLFDPKQMPDLPQPSTDASQGEPKLKEDILSGLYGTSTFEKLWNNLSQCLTAIRKRGNMINVAAILLPVIESLMVVCRNSSLKDSTVDPVSPQLARGSPQPPEAHLESLFFTFTEEHRKILNELIRNTPKLMNGNLAVLAKNSKVLEFDNKRSYFARKLHNRATETRVSHPSLQLSVRRDQVFLDSFKSLYYKSGDEIKYGKLNIRFHGEEGIDAGGVSREWFAAMARQMFNPDYALFNPVASDRTTFHPNPLSEINGEHLMFFKFIGRIIGKALYEGRLLDCHFSRAVYRRILGKSVSVKDMESLDLAYYKSLVWILENDITDVTFETFSVDVDRFGLVETVDLIEGGRDIAVTESNKHEYVRLVVEHRLIKSVEEQLEHFLTGFHDIIPPELISIFNEQELELLISGLPEIDIDDWKNNSEYHNYQGTSPQIQWFWRAVRSFDKEEKAKLLQFITGTSKVPLNGFKELEGMNGFAKFNIHRDYSSKEKLPSSHTCFNQLDLPEYDSYERLRQQLYTAITAGSEYFGFA